MQKKKPKKEKNELMLNYSQVFRNTTMNVKKKWLKAFYSRGSRTKSDEVPQVLSLELVLTGAEVK